MKNIPFSSFDQKDQKPSLWGEKRRKKKNISGEVVACQSRKPFPFDVQRLREEKILSKVLQRKASK